MEYLNYDWEGFAYSRAASISIDDFYLTASKQVCLEVVSFTSPLSMDAAFLDLDWQNYV